MNKIDDACPEMQGQRRILIKHYILLISVLGGEQESINDFDFEPEIVSDFEKLINFPIYGRL